MVDATPLSVKTSKTSYVSLSDDEVKNLADNVLEDITYTAGPIYHGLNKRLACIYFKEQKHQDAIFHLAESHGCSLRHLAMYRYCKLQMNEKLTADKREMGKHLYKIVEIQGQYFLDKYQGLQSRLAELPSEWTIVQITVQYDPQLRFTQNPTREKNPIHLTRMSCGNLVKKKKSFNQGGPPLSVFLSPCSNSSDALDIASTIMETLKSHNQARTNFMTTSTISKNFSIKLQGLISDFEQLLGDTNCVLPGNLVDTKLHKTICSKVDKIVKDLVGSKEVTETQLQVLYLLATSPVALKTKESKVLNAVIKDTLLSDKLYKAISKLHDEYQDVLAASARHPVIMILDELLDILPIEMINVLKNHPVTRVPSVHFAQALYREHAYSIFQSGINSENGYFILNPSGDLKDCEKKLQNLLPTVAPKWEGISGVPPTEKQFLNALAKKSIFLYCGHGGGNQYADLMSVERTRTQAVSFLIGCSSVKVNPLGGRIDGTCIFNSYMIGGCPCTVGMLWDVTDADSNRMTEYLLERWLKPVEPTKSQSVDDICRMVKNLNLIDEKTGEPDLARLLPMARAKACHLRNSAALVIKGLPVKINWS